MKYNEIEICEITTFVDLVGNQYLYRVYISKNSSKKLFVDSIKQLQVIIEKPIVMIFVQYLYTFDVHTKTKKS